MLKFKTSRNLRDNFTEYYDLCTNISLIVDQYTDI